MSLISALAQEAPLLKRAQDLFRPLAKEAATADNSLTHERIVLGRSLFFDPRLTIDAKISCSSCHQPSFYGTDTLPRAIGVKERPHPRNTPTVLNVSTNSIVHWRGDRSSLEDQVVQALTSPITSGQPNQEAVIDRFQRIAGYAPLFKAAFPNDVQPVTAQNIAVAISAYERTLETSSSFDAYLAGNENALSQAAAAGLAKFISTGCGTCHDGIGIGGRKLQKFGLIEDYWKATGSDPIDNGRADVTKNPADLYVFRVPSLRNVARTPPYFHDGSVSSLQEAVRVMARVQLGTRLSEDDIGNLVAFLESLTGVLPAEFTPPPLPTGVVTPLK